MTIDPKIVNLMKSATPANTDTPPSKPIKEKPESTRVTIIAKDKGMIAIGGSNYKRTFRPIVSWVLAITLIVVVLFTFKISTAQAQNLSKSVKAVADCEDKHPNQVHRELKNQYNYDKYTNLNLVNYSRIMLKLNQRNTCHA